MNRIDDIFQCLKKEKKTGFIGFLTAGDPDIETCKKLILQLAENGCDVIEIGVPFSDPIAEGPQIQEASLRALKHQIKTRDIMDMVKELRELTKVPFVYLLYYNQILKYGIESFFLQCNDCGIDGVILPDLPYEHQGEIRDVANKYNIYIISLITPVSGNRKELIAKTSEGFLYCVTSLGVTGERTNFNTDLKGFVDELQAYTTTPKALGFGISTVEQIQEMRSFADALIVGSAIVRHIAKISEGTGSIEDVGAFVKTLTEACHGE